MTARVLFFGATADIAGKRLLEVETPDNLTAAAVLRKLVEDYPALGRHQLKVSVNQNYASGDTMVQDGDEIGVFTAVSGG
jgi:molybdopterin converting factor small subunit